MDDIVKVTCLHAEVMVQSFALRKDMPVSNDLRNKASLVIQALSGSPEIEQSQLVLTRMAA